MENMEKSHEYFEIAKQIIPGGAQNARRPSCFTKEYPIFTYRGNGAHIWDVDEHEYIDWMLSFGPIILGHCNSAVDESVKKVMQDGFLFNMSAPLHLAFAKKLIEHVPCAEKVIVTISGSEAAAAAVRIARIYTGKEIIVKWGYHGWLDWCVDNHAGITSGTYNYIKTFTYNDLYSLEKVLEKNKNNVACIIMMPFEVILPDPGFLEGVRELANMYKIVLIFDEIRSWPRLGLGGAQEYYGVIPDITTISKGIANGYPISVVVGKSEIMDAAEKTVISATYFPSTLGMAAALEVIRQLEDKKVLDHILMIAEKLGNGLKDIIESRNVNATIFGAPQMPFLMFGDREANIKSLNAQTMSNAATSAGGEDIDSSENRKVEQLTELFYSETIKRGIFFHPKHHWFSCLAHTEEDVNKTLKASEEALDIAIKNI